MSAATIRQVSAGIAGQPTTDGAGVNLTRFKRLEEPIARAGPFVLNTREQLEQAFRDYQAGVLDS